MDINKIINEKFKKIKNFNIKISQHERLMEIFTNSLNENDEERDYVIDLIKNNEWEEENPENFYKSLNKSKHKQMLTDYSVSELAHMKLFKLKGFDIGYALKTNQYKPYSEIVAVHNNEPNIGGIGDYLIQSAIDNGGCYLDHFATDFLNDIYSKAGFKEYKRDEYDPQYDPDGSFKAKYDALPIIYRKYVGC